jgi:glycosyltransferase involved in cell wall biosynthesis
MKTINTQTYISDLLNNRKGEIYTEELPVSWRWTPDNYLGGTPEMAINVAKSLEDNVIVYYDGDALEHDGVYYLPRSLYKGNDIVLAINSRPQKLGNYNIIWFSWNNVKDINYLDFNERIVLSPYHQSIFGSNSRVVPLTCNPDDFQSVQKIKKQCLYSSSPDRGGHFLKSIWNEVEAATGAKLICTYEGNHSEEDMKKLYKESEFWLHPGQGVELFCISAVKAQVAGCIPVVVPNMALETTVKYGVKTTIENYKNDLINAILNPPKVETVDFGNWDVITKEIFKNVRK